MYGLVLMATFLSTLPARGATESASGAENARQISIHAPREGSDRHTRRERFPGHRFLSTLPARGATRLFPLGSASVVHFYPRSPRGERRDLHALNQHQM